MKGLFLDDCRFPSDVEEWIDFEYSNYEWRIVRNYDDFVKALNKEEFDIISFDHDLDQSSTFECIRSNTHKCVFDYSKVREKTGKDCAEYLKDFCAKNLKDIIPYILHSLNKQGRENIMKILGKEKMVATYKEQLIFDKADEILSRRKKNGL